MQNILLMYFLQRSRYAEAVSLNEQMESTDRHSDKDCSVRRSIMERYRKANLLPMTTLTSRPAASSWWGKKVTTPIQLKVSSHGGAIDPKFHSGAVHEEMEKRRAEMFSSDKAEPYTPFRYVGLQ